MPITATWACPFTLPLSERPAWAVPPAFVGDQMIVADQPSPCTYGVAGSTCDVPGCTCLALDSDGLCEGHWLDTK